MSDATRGDAPEGRPQMARAVVLVVAAVIVAVLVLRHTGSSSTSHVGAGTKSTTTTTTTREKKPTTTTTVPRIPASKTTVQVLNGLQSGSLAGNLSTRLKARGYQVLPADDTTAVDQTSIVYVVDQKYRPEAFVLARRLGLTAADVERHIPSTAPIPAGVTAKANLVVIIGTSLEHLASSA